MLLKQYFLQKKRSASIISPQCTVRCKFYPVLFSVFPLHANLHSPERRLIELRMEHGDLNALIDRAAEVVPTDELMLRRLKKKKLALRDEIDRIERSIQPNEPA
jgi:hypothetical protein